MFWYDPHNIHMNSIIFQKHNTQRKAGNQLSMAWGSLGHQRRQFTSKKNWNPNFAGKTLWWRSSEAYPATEDILLQILEVE